MGDRKLASVRKIKDIKSIEGADKIEVALVDGWYVVVKKGEFSVGDLVRYFEIDSWIPYSLAPFLTKEGDTPKEFKGVLGQRLRTVKLRGQISQGLLLPAEPDEELGEDLTDKLGILKWELPAYLAKSRPNNLSPFPDNIPKTKQERVQNLGEELDSLRFKWYTFEVTEKLDGMSMTVFKDLNGNFGVCSRNYKLDLNESSILVDLVKSMGLEGTLPRGFALQGEVIGSKIQNNSYKLNHHKFYVYNALFEHQGSFEYLYPAVARAFSDNIGVKYVPVINGYTSIDSLSVDDLLELSEGKSLLNPDIEREGVVLKINSNRGAVGNFSFKCISNKWLLKNKM